MTERNKVNIDQSEENFKKQLEKEPLEKGDIPAMIIAGLLVAIPVMLIVSVLVLLCYWFVAGRG